MHIILIVLWFSRAAAHGVPTVDCDGEHCSANRVSSHVLLQSKRISGKNDINLADDTKLDLESSVVIDLYGPDGEPPSPFLPLCAPSIVTRACAVLNGQEFGSATGVTKSMLAKFLATNESNTCFDSGFHTDGMTCTELCNVAVDYLTDHGSYVVPNASDLACVTTSDGRTTCEIDVRPNTIARESNLYVPKIDEFGGHKEQPAAFVYQSDSSGKLRQTGPDDAPTRMQTTSKNSLSNGDMLYSNCADFAVQIANLFRIHPSVGTYIPVGGPEGLSLASTSVGSSEEKLHEYHAIAEVWAATVLNELDAGTAGEFRDEWFGGSGSKSRSQVKERVVKTFNFIKRELQQGFHYVYPADSAASTACKSTTLAFVWSYDRTGTDYHETVGPECWPSQSGFDEQCGVDSDGKYYVYICNYWNNFDKQAQIATIIHEAAHHSGPGDRSYNKDTMQNFDQGTQLDNAANYQNFGRDIVESAWGCSEPERVAISGYGCSGQDTCPCRAFSSLCGSNSEVTSKCPSTCGQCNAPGSGSVAPPRRRRAATVPPSDPSGCVDSGTYKDPQYGDDCPAWVGFKCTGYDFTEELQKNCPVACKQC